ncbi:hypothetical protein CBM2637_B110427 [Cupriavidus taiwanensis]|nr:hypothetical protein CBM2637_B110427 [Cupriavidus taiwanensis]
MKEISVANLVSSHKATYDRRLVTVGGLNNNKHKQASGVLSTRCC